MKVGEYYQDRQSLYYTKKTTNDKAEIIRLNGKKEIKDIEIAKRINNKISLENNDSVHFVFKNIKEACDYLELNNISYDKDNVFKILSIATKHFVNINPEYNISEYLYTLKNYCFGFKIPLIRFNNIKWLRLFLLAEHNKWEWPITLSCNNSEIWFPHGYGYTEKEYREIINLNDFDVLKKIHHLVLMHDSRGKRFQFDKYHCRLNDEKQKYICFIKIIKPITEEQKEKDEIEAIKWIKKYFMRKNIDSAKEKME